MQGFNSVHQCCGFKTQMSIFSFNLRFFVLLVLKQNPQLLNLLNDSGFFPLSSLHQSAPSLFLKSNFEYLRGNYRKAVKLLNSSNIAEHPGPIKTGDRLARVSLWTREAGPSSETLSLPVVSPPGECVRCMFWNNLGCIHFAMGKHNLGIFYFKKALQENDHTCAQLGDGSNGQCESRFHGASGDEHTRWCDSPPSRSLHSSDERSVFTLTPLCLCCCLFFFLCFF